MTDEMWREYGLAQRKCVQGDRAWWDLGTAACNTIVKIERQRVEDARARDAYITQALGT